MSRSSERLLTAAEVGELLGLATGTILDRWERGDLPGYRLFGKRGGPVRFRLSEIEAALASWRVASDDERARVRGGPSREDLLQSKSR